MNLGTSLQGVGVGVTNTGPLTAQNPTNDPKEGTVYSGTLTPANAAKLCSKVTNTITFLMK